jgi:hypothetical protein
MKTLISDHDYELHLGGTVKPGFQLTDLRSQQRWREETKPNADRKNSGGWRGASNVDSPRLVRGDQRVSASGYMRNGASRKRQKVNGSGTPPSSHWPGRQYRNAISERCCAIESLSILRRKRDGIG